MNLSPFGNLNSRLSEEVYSFLNPVVNQKRRSVTSHDFAVKSFITDSLRETVNVLDIRDVLRSATFEKEKRLAGKLTSWRVWRPQGDSNPL